mmetsp:Transcript_17214/g.39788  ORF Transcript_17214/g.39788 Transcript_17214/m.39788 type:complete len:95 (+) Transcript_17214:1736-2020(+)
MIAMNRNFLLASGHTCWREPGTSTTSTTPARTKKGDDYRATKPNTRTNRTDKSHALQLPQFCLHFCDKDRSCWNIRNKIEQIIERNIKRNPNSA